MPQSLRPLQNLPEDKARTVSRGRSHEMIVSDYVKDGSNVVVPSANRDDNDGRPLRGFNPYQQMAQVVMGPGGPYIWDPKTNQRYPYEGGNKAETLLMDLNRPSDQHRPTALTGSEPAPQPQEASQPPQSPEPPTDPSAAPQPQRAPEEPARNPVQVTIGIAGFGRIPSLVREAVVDQARRLVALVVDTQDTRQFVPDLEPTQQGQALLLEIDDFQAAVEYFGWRYTTGDGLDHVLFMIAPPANP